MFIQNPYGRGANVSSGLSGLSESLRDMFKQEMAERQADRANSLALKNQAIQLKQLDLEGQRQQALGQLALQKLNLQQAQNEMENRRWGKQFNLKDAYNTAQIEHMQNQDAVAQQKADQLGELNTEKVGYYQERANAVKQANESLDALAAFNIPQGLRSKWQPILESAGVPAQMTRAQWAEYGKRNPHVATMVSAGLFDETVDALITQAEIPVAAAPMTPGPMMDEVRPAREKKP